jgi:hypothetical protein
MTRLLLLLLCGMSAWAQTSAVKGKAVIDEALAALGGERFLSVQNRIETGRVYSFFHEELSGLASAMIYTKYVPVADTSSMTPLAIRERQSYLRLKKEQSAVLFTDADAYQITFRGARPLSSDSLERYRIVTLSNVFYILRVRLHEPGMVFEYKGQEVWSNQPVNVVDITDSENRVVTVYFNQSTKFPVHQVFYHRDPKTKRRIEEVADYGKYREVGQGVWWPLTTQRTRDGEKIYEIYSDSVSINQTMSESLFLLPTDIKMQKKL